MMKFKSLTPAVRKFCGSPPFALRCSHLLLMHTLSLENNGSESTVWCCFSRIEPRGIKCRTRTLREEVLEKACFSAFTELLKNMSKTEEQNKNVSTEEQQDVRSGGTEFLRKTMVPAGQNKDSPNETQDPENALLELCPDELKEYVSRQRSVLIESDALMLRRWLQRITVFDDRLQFDFRTGFSVEIEA